MKNFLLVIIMLITFTFSSYAQFCDGLIDSTITAGTYTGDYVLSANKVYKLTGKIYIGNAVAGNGASLTIPAGTLLFGDKPSKAALVITRGAQGFFLGTAQNPIVFTSCFPPGQRNPGDWGGLVILGNAPNNRGTEVVEGGFDVVLGNHGGGVASDNSGIFQYVRVEFSGVPFTTDDETNGITMGSVGSGTVMDHLQVNFSGDDGFEWFGGTNNLKYLVSYKTLDDDFDTDHGWIGKVQYGFAYRDKNLADVSNSEAFESDNVNGPFYAAPRTAPIFSNMTLIGPKKTTADTDFDPEFFTGVHQRRGTLQNIYNSAFSGWPDGMVRLDGAAVNGALMVGGAAIDTFKFSHLTFAGTPRGTSTSLTLTQWNTWFDQVVYDNDDLTNPLDLNLVDQFNDLNPNLTPNSSSSLNNSGTNPSAINAFFESNDYRGAFAPVGTTDDFKYRWDLGWTNYNPQATPYGVDITISNTITVVGSVGTRSIVFGRAPGATDGLDASLGELEAPPLPPSAEIDVRWQLPTADQSVFDLRSNVNLVPPSSPIIYTFNVQWGSGATGPQLITWDADNLTGGSYTLKDGAGGAIYNVNMRTQNSLSVATGVTQFKIEVDYDFNGAVTVCGGWSLVGAMGNYPTGNLVTNWWAGKDPSSSVFKYTTPCDGPAGYTAITSMIVGQGVWMKNLTAQTYNSGGEWSALWYAYNDPISICTGWNLISGLDYVALVSELGTVPNNLLTGVVYGYTCGAGYQQAVTLDPGKGYWAKFTANGQLIVPGPLTGVPKVADIIQKDWGKIILTDNSGNSYTLYSAANVDLNNYELPPLPPSGLFDVRFGSQRFVEDLSSGNNTIDFTGVGYPVKIKVEGMSIRLQDVTGKIVDSELKSGEEIVINNSGINKLIVVSGEVIPDNFILEQNYPNPFNPSTSVKFHVPQTSDVTITIYDMLGQEVRTLFAGEVLRGSYTVNWDGMNNSGVTMSSGSYVYRMIAGEFVQSKKMVLVK